MKYINEILNQLNGILFNAPEEFDLTYKDLLSFIFITVTLYILLVFALV